MRTMKQIRNLSLGLIALAIVSCGQKQQGGAPGGAAGQVKEYPVIAVTQQSTTLFKDYAAKLEGQQTVEIRSKIAGYIDKIMVDEGAFVKKGQALFRLNANDLQAAVRSSEASVKVAEADVNSAAINLEKTKPLVEKNIISKFELESVSSTLKAKEAQLAQAKANLENAKANLQYTVITSPAEGTIGTFPYRVGSLVSSTSAEPLTTVSNTAKVYAYFSFNEKEFLTLVKGLEGKNLQEKFAKLPDVSLVLADNSVYEQPGRIETASGLIDQQTGSINVRATFPNTEGLLRSGGSGMVRIPQFINSAIIIPQKTTYELQGKYFVYLVGSDNKVHNTEIQIVSGNLKDSYVVTNGLKVGDQIVLQGIASLRNDTEIKPKLVEAGSLSENTPAATNQGKN
ncbi:RND efflux membrane fusion protein [Aquipluma nitroreducens]|uniref:RND efflux membrane fusion protein n=1 Tax=Aquipluma nitroreducens TaxID=2010828 RepID=A0A5K7S8S9_9BACT|nr:efflux RND transporter periplasmic adaptor subunit [Aquipluma nitroreducens]BBE17936.1 RND efflux membrane fusion protein [Aquipluma nitroreducens]